MSGERKNPVTARMIGYTKERDLYVQRNATF